MTVQPSPAGLRRTAVDIGLTFGRQFLAGLLQLVLMLVVARLLGPQGAGVYAIALLLPTLMSQLLNLGIGSANVFFIASGRASVAEAWAASRDLTGVLAILGLVFGASVIVAFGERAFPGVPTRILLSALLIYPFSLTANIGSGVLQALRDFRAFNMTVLVQPVLAVLGAGLMWLTGAFDLGALLLMISATYAVAMAATLASLARHVPLFAPTVARMEYLRPALIYGFKAHLSNILTFLTYRLDIFLVNLLAGPAAAGIYTVAVRLVEQLWLISTACSTVILPHLSGMRADDAGRVDFTAIMARSVLWVTLLGGGVMAVLAQPVIVLLFGAKFEGAVTALLVLLPGIVVLSCARVLANDLAARGMVGVNLAVAAAVLITNTGANFVLIPRLGIAGAAAATTLAYMLNFVIGLALQRLVSGAHWATFLLPTSSDFARLRTSVRKLRTR